MLAVNNGGAAKVAPPSRFSMLLRGPGARGVSKEARRFFSRPAGV